jgi:ribosomal subunit interface protein
MKLQGVDSAIIVESGNVQMGDALAEHARTAILQSAGQYFGRLHRAIVHFSREGYGYRCSIQMQMGGLTAASAQAQHKDIYRAFDQAHERVAKQLRRSKRELRDDKPDGPNKTMLLLDGLKELKRVRDHAHEPQPRPGVQHPPAFVPLMERLLDGEREASLLFVVEDVARELRVPYATALGWVIEFFDEKLDPALAVGHG